MKCRVCGQPSAGLGGLLCGDCTRALARARAGPPAARKAPAAAVHRPVNKIHLTAPVSPAPVRVPRKRALVLWTVVAVAVSAIGVAGTRAWIAPRGQEIGVGDRAAETAAATQDRGPAESEPQNADRQPSPPSADAKSLHGALPTANARGAPVAREAARAAPGAAKAPSGRGANASRQFAADAERDKASAASASDGGPTNYRVSSAAASPAPPSDDSQTLAIALQQCGEEEFLAGVICEQKARLRYCDGKWGRVPQCTPKPRVE